MGPQARIWNVYLDEAEIYDKEVIEGYSGSVDILLVFVSLFHIQEGTPVIERIRLVYSLLWLQLF